MRSQIANTALGIAGMMILATVPAYCDNLMISFNIGTGSGHWSETLAGVANNTPSTTFTLDQLIVKDINTSVTETFNLASGFFTLAFNTASTGTTSTGLMITNVGTGTGNKFANVGTGVNLYSALTSLAWVDGNGAGSQSANMTTLNQTVSGTVGVTTTSATSTFLSDLGITATSALDIQGGISGSGSAGAGTISSDTIALTMQGSLVTPEPASVFLFGTGLIALGMIARKRRPAKI
jgi:hypothetical protein